MFVGSALLGIEVMSLACSALTLSSRRPHSLFFLVFCSWLAVSVNCPMRWYFMHTKHFKYQQIYQKIARTQDNEIRYLLR